MISFSNFDNDGNVKTFEGHEYHIREDKITHKQCQLASADQGNKAQFHSLFRTGAYINMKKFLENEKMQIKQETEDNAKNAPGTKTSLFLHDLPLQG